MERHLDRGRHGVLAAAAVAVICATLAPAPAQAAPTWLAPIDVSEPVVDYAREQAVAMAAQGDAVVVWRERSARTANKFVIRAARRPAGGTFNVGGQTISDPDENATDPQVAIDAQGNAVAVWEECCDDTTFRIVVKAAISSGGSFGPAQTLSDLSKHSSAPQVAVNSRGDAVAAWLVDVRASPFDDAAFTVQAAVRPAGAGFAVAKTISAVFEPVTATLATGPHAAISADGRAAVVWQECCGTGGFQETVVRAAVRPAGAQFPDPPGLYVSNATESGTNRPGPRVAMDAQGNAVAVFQHCCEGSPTPRRVIKAAGRAASQPSWATATTISDTATGSDEPDVAMNAQGHALAVWRAAPSSGNRVIAAAGRPPGGSFGDPVAVSSSSWNAGDAPRAAVDPQGTGIALWWADKSGSPTDLVQAAARPLGGAFGEARDLAERSDVLDDVDVSVDGQGNAIALWAHGDIGVNAVEAAGYDAAPPALNSLSVPGSGAIGQALPFSVTPADVWSPATSTWDFGDGAAATGNEATHAYGREGGYAVAVTAIDAVGNSAGASRGLTIAPPGAAFRPDKDGDGFDVTVDCDDTNPAVHPKAREIRGNLIDENCDTRVEPFARIKSTVQSAGFARGRRTSFTRLRVKGVPAGAKVQLRCKGRRCPLKRKVVKGRRGTVNLVKLFGRRGMLKFRAGQVVEVRITAPEMVGKVVRYKIRAGEFTVGKTLCLPVGSARAQAVCR